MPIPDGINTLTRAGISMDDAYALRRISMTLHRWHELECGDSDNYKSICLSRGRKDKGGAFEYADDGKPYMEYHSNHSNGARYTLLADKERGALKRLDAILKRYPQFTAYVQGDPRGASLYILDKSTTPQPYDQFYSRGIAVYR